MKSLVYTLVDISAAQHLVQLGPKLSLDTGHMDIGHCTHEPALRGHTNAVPVVSKCCYSNDRWYNQKALSIKPYYIVLTLQLTG